MKKLLLFVIFLPSLWAQSSPARWDIGGPVPGLSTISTGPIPYFIALTDGVKLNWCQYPANSIQGSPCTNYSPTYTDTTLTTACPSTQPIVLQNSNVCRTTSDAEGNLGVYVPAGIYTYTLTDGSITYGPYVVTLGAGSGGGGGAANQSVAFTSVLSATLTVSSSTANIVYECWDNNSPANSIVPANVSINPSTFLVTFTFAVAQSGYCVVNSSGGSGGGGGGTPGGSNGNIQYNNLGAFGGFSDGTSTQVLHGGKTFGSVALTSDVAGILPQANGGNGSATPGIVAGTNVTVSGSWPNQTINSSGGGGSGVTSVGLTQTGSIFNITGSPVTTAGNINLGFNSQAANTFFAAPNGSASVPSFRTIVGADVPTLNQNTTGTASNLSGTPALPNGTTATTQTVGDSTTKLATDAFVLANAGGVSGLTLNFLPKANSSTTLTNSLCDEGVTTANVFTCSDSAGAAFTSKVVISGTQWYTQGPFSTIPATPGASLSALTFATGGHLFISPNNGTFVQELERGGVIASDVVSGTFATGLIPDIGNVYSYIYSNGTNWPGLSGDVTTPSGSFVTTLANTGVTGTTCGDSTHSCGLTYNAKGLLTAVTNNAISGGGGASSLDAITGSAAQATGTETAAGHEYTFAGVETGNLTHPFSLTNSNTSNNNSSGAVIIATTGTSTGAVPLRLNEVTTAGNLIEGYTGGTLTNGVLSGGTLEFNITAAGLLGINGIQTNSTPISGSTNTTNVTIRGGQNASANSALGTAILQGGNETGAGGSASKGGNALVEGGTNAATNAASLGGGVQLLPGASTGATQGLQGLLVQDLVYVKSGTSTQWNLQCISGTTASTSTDCGASPTNLLGVAEVVSSNTVQVSFAGQIPINASAAVTIGDTVCAGSTAGKVTDSATTASCLNSQGIQVGTVVATSGAYTLPDGTTFTATTTLPLVQLNTPIIATNSLTNPMTTANDIIVGGSAGSPNRLAAPTAVNGVPQTITSTPSGGVAGNLAWGPAGVVPRASTCTSNADTILATDRAGFVTETDSTSTCIVTIPQASSTGFASNYVFVVKCVGTQSCQLEATTSTIDGIAGATGVPMLPGSSRFVYSDNTNYFTVPISKGFGGVNVKTTNYTLTALDKDEMVVMNCSGACVATLPATPPTANWTSWILSIGSTLATVSLNSLSFNGAGTAPTLVTGHAIQVRTDATNYFGDITAGGGGGAGTVTSIATTSPITGGTITSTGTIACATCVVASSPGAGIAHFAGSTQTVTSSAVVNGDITSVAESKLTGSAAATSITESGTGDAITRLGVETANLTAPYVFTNTNSSNNNTSIGLGITTPGTSTGQTTLNINGAATGGDLTDWGTGGTWASGVLSGQTNVAKVGITGAFTGLNFTANGTTAGFADYPQGSTSSGVAPCNAATSICEQAPTSVTSYLITKPGTAPTNAFSVATTTTAGVQSWNKMQQTGFSTGSYTNSTTTFSSVTGLSFSVDASTNYGMECHLYFSASASTAGLKAQVTGPASPTSVILNLHQPLTSTTYTDTPAAAFSSSMGVTTTTTTSTNFEGILTMGLVNGTNAGTVQVQLAAEGTGTLTLQNGSYCKLQ